MPLGEISIPAMRNPQSPEIDHVPSDPTAKIEDETSCGKAVAQSSRRRQERRSFRSAGVRCHVAISIPSLLVRLVWECSAWLQALRVVDQRMKTSRSSVTSRIFC